MAQVSDQSNGASEPSAEPIDPAEELPAEGQAQATANVDGEPHTPEPPWQLPVDGFPAEGEPLEESKSAAAEGLHSPQPEPFHAQPPEPEDPARPARKGWWQRRFSGT